jgi:ketosteroid isomerase-like protein
MSEENVRSVRESYATPGALFATWAGRMAPDVEFDFTAVYPDKPVMNGIEELRRFREQGPWEELRFEPERFFDVDEEHVLVFVRVNATGKGSGVPVDLRNAHEFTIRDGMLVRFKVYRDRDEALEAAGLTG